MQFDYSVSGHSENDSLPPFLDKSKSPAAPKPRESPASSSYIPPVCFDDTELVSFAIRDGPRLPPATRILYVTFARLTDPETGYSTPSHEQLANEAVMSISSIKEHLGYLVEFGKISKTNRSTPDTGTLPNAYYFVGLDSGLVPREMNLPCSNPIKAARSIFQREELDALHRKHAAEIAVLQAEWDTDRQFWALVEERLKTAGIELPDRPEPPSMDVSTADSDSLAVEAGLDTPRQILPTQSSHVVSERHRRVADKVKKEWAWMHSSFTKAGININGAIRYFARSEDNEEDLDFQIANYYAGEAAKQRPRTKYRIDDVQEPLPPPVPLWDGPPPDPEAEQLWQTVLENLQARLPRPTYETWLRPTVGMVIETGEREVFVVAAPTPFGVEWLERRMFHALVTELEKAAGRQMELQLRTLESVVERRDSS